MGTYIHARGAFREQGREQQRLLCFVVTEKEDLTRERVPQIAPETDPSRFERELSRERVTRSESGHPIHERVAAPRKPTQEDADGT